MYTLNTQLPSRQLYLDSRYGSEVDGHNTDIKFDLNQMIEVQYTPPIPDIFNVVFLI